MITVHVRNVILGKFFLFSLRFKEVEIHLYAMIISVQKLTQVIKSNTAGFLRIQRHNRKILKRILKRPLK